MPSLIYNSAVRDEATGAIDYDTDTFYAMLVTDAYTPNKDTHTKRSHVTNEVTGTGYTSGGIAVTATVGAVDTANDRVVITFAAHEWPSSTITANGEVIYKRRGGASSADELVMFNEFATNITSTNGAFSVAPSTLTKQN
jgi:hypothetical protein